jgi:cytoskeleton protein RodZ
MAREARGASISEVAAALKLSPRQVEAIENEDFSRLTGATFIRGFVRNYAKLLKIDAGPVLTALEERAVLPPVVLNAPADVGVKMPSSSAKHGKGLLAATVLALCLLGVAVALYFDFIDLTSLFQFQGKPVASSAPQAAQAEAQVVQPLPQPVAEAPQQQPAEQATEVARQPDSAESPAASQDAQKLIFSFDGSSWVEVKDATGHTILSQMNAKGTTQMVEGRPPFQLVVGNASQVRLQYKDQPVDLGPHTRVEVARLTLE